VRAQPTERFRIAFLEDPLDISGCDAPVLRHLRQGRTARSPSRCTARRRQGDKPLELRLCLPESWTSQPERMAAARVPLQHQAPRTKNEIALDLLDQVHAEGYRTGP
jgi:hypothetical protein